jgi:peptidoglycan/LPS O-acetylase OafA/YrhL
VKNYLSGLNGLRAIAAITVILAHTTLRLEAFGLNKDIFGYLENGEMRTLDFAGYGVSIFFVLSGFLITYLLLKEKQKNGVNLKKFYFRRILRIWPLYYFYIIIVLLTLAFFSIDYNYSDISFYIFLSANFGFVLGHTIPFLGQYWSLGVEEQFYIFWPIVCRLKNSLLLRISIIGIVGLIGLKTVLHIFVPGSFFEELLHINRFHCMLMGAVGALLFYNKNAIFINISSNKLTQIISWSVYLLAMLNQFHIASFLDNEIISIVTVFIIVGQVTKSSFINLEKKWANFIGRISFGLYVYHPIMIYFLSRVIYFEEVILMNYLIVYSSVISLTIAVSWISYNYLESYFLRIKDSRYSNL